MSYFKDNNGTCHKFHLENKWGQTTTHSRTLKLKFCRDILLNTNSLDREEKKKKENEYVETSEALYCVCTKFRVVRRCLIFHWLTNKEKKGVGLYYLECRRHSHQLDPGSSSLSSPIQGSDPAKDTSLELALNVTHAVGWLRNNGFVCTSCKGGYFKRLFIKENAANSAGHQTRNLAHLQQFSSEVENSSYAQ